MPHDEYGGSFADRMRYPLEVIRAVRESVGPDFVVGARMNFDEQRPEGLTRTRIIVRASDAALGCDYRAADQASYAEDEHAKEIGTCADLTVVMFATNEARDTWLYVAASLDDRFLLGDRWIITHTEDPSTDLVTFRPRWAA